MNREEAAAGKNQLKADLRIPAPHEAQQFDLLFGVRREVGVATFGRYDAIAAAIPSKYRLAKPGTGSDERTRATRLRITRIEHGKIRRRKIFDAMAPSNEVIEQRNVRNAEFLGEDGGVHGPRKVGGAHAIVNHGAGDAESRRANFFVAQMSRSDPSELLGDEIELREILAAKTLLENRRKFAAALGKKREVAFGAADIASQNHEVPLRGLKRFN